ncbi:MAG: peptidoglycan-binding domain-containing protein [Woeseiaceae bacterium]
MLKFVSCVVAAGVLFLPLLAQSQSAESILETAKEKQLERWEGVDVYAVDQSVMGTSTKTYFQRTEVVADNGNAETLFLPVSNLNSGQCLGPQTMTPEALELYAQGAEMTGAGAAGEIEDGLEDAGLPRGLLAASGSSPNATFDPRVMMGGGAAFARAAADSQRQQAASGDRDAADARDAANHMAQFMENARLIGTESINGRSAYHLQSDITGQVQEVDGREYRMERVSMWLDAEEYVPLQMKVDGTLTSGTEVKPMAIENSMSDYRQVPNSRMYEAYKRNMKISGMLDAAQQAEMQEAAGQLAEFEKEMANMPANQRIMMENMMGDKLKMMRDMAAGGGYQSEIVINSIVVNPAVPGVNNVDCVPVGQQNAVAAPVIVPTSAAAPVAATTPDAGPATDDLTTMVQRDLTTLGYNTGGTNGDLNTETIVAISKFQAENNMEVTGAVSPQLAGILSAKVSAANNPPARDPAELQAAQQACLQEKITAAQASQKKKRGFGSLMRAVTRTAGQMGNYDLYQTTSDIYNANATAEDLASAAKDLGLTEDEVAACQNPM